MAPAAASEAAVAAGRLPSVLARPTQLLAVLLLLACAAGPPGAAAQALTDGQMAVVEQQCPVSLRYAVSLGQPPDNGTSTPQVPIFVAVLTLQNNANYTIEEWRLGWRFPYDSVIKSQQDIFDQEITLLVPDSVTTALASDSVNRTIEPGGEVLFSFLGNKGAGQLNASNPYNVGAIQSVTFNNLRCNMVTAVPPQQAAPALPPAAEQVAEPTDLQIEYTPIEYLGQPMVATFTQFLIRVRNIRNESALSMSSTRMQYWFDGPVEGAPLFADYNPEQFFMVQCEWATTGCDSVGLTVQPGLANTPGAAFLLNITWNPKAGLLLPSGENAVPALFLGKGVDVMDLLVTLTTKQGVALLNSTQDFSFMETPELPLDTNSTIIPRRALPNPQIPAFLDGRLVWGRLPTPRANASSPAALPGALGGRSGVAMAAGGNGSGNGSMAALPAGITCETTKDGKGQNCGLMAVYCCQGLDEVTPFIPEQLPSPAPEAVVNVESIHQLQPAMETVPATAAPALSPPPPTSANASAPAAAPSSQKSSSTGMVAGIAGGVAAALAVAAALGFFMLRRKRRRQQQINDRRLLEADAAAAAKADSGKEHDGQSTPRNGSGAAGAGRHAHFSAAGVPIGAGWKAGSGALTEVVVPGAPVRPLWGAPPSELGSAASSPSKAGSLVPLLRSAPSARSGLLKFPSGVSAVSSHDNPMFDDAGEHALWPAAPTQQSVLPQHVGSWELQSQLVTQQAMAQAQAAAAAAAAAAASQQRGQQQQQQEEEDGWRPDVLAMMERKGATAPTLLVEARPERSRQLRRRRSGGSAAGGSDESGSSSSEGEEEGEDCFTGSGSSGAADWQVRRSKSWDGHLQDTATLGDSLPLFLRRRRAQPTQLLQALPPLAPLAPPVLPSSQPAPGVDLNVDYQTEVAPFLGRCLGQGGFGTVYEATWRGKRVAVKKLPHFGPDQPCSEGMYAALLREIELASKFSSERLVKVYGACTADREHVCLIMELMEGGNLFQRIYDRCKRRMSYLEILQVAHDMAAGLAYLHPSVVHRDLKPQNILLDAEGRAKLADFGISRVKDPTKSYLSQVTNDNGTPMYMAPEQFNGSRVDEKVDVYALGIILNECFTRRQPWRDSSHFFQIILKVAINGERPWLDPDCPEPLRRLITKCWHQDPHMRPSCAEVMRLTAFMIQEEVHRWEQLQSAGGGHVRLPTAARPGGAHGGAHNHINGFRRTSLQAPLPPIPSGDPTPAEQQPTQPAQQGPKHAQTVQVEGAQQQQQQEQQQQQQQREQREQQQGPAPSAASLAASSQPAAQQQGRLGSDSPPPAPTPEQAVQPGRQWPQQ